MSSILSELPFFPEQCTLSQLPFFSEPRFDGYELPPKPSSVCERCWEGPFAMHFGLHCVPSRYQEGCSEFQYSIPLEQLKSGYDMRCVWCAFVYEQCLENYRQWGASRDVIHNKTVKITMVWRHSGDQYNAGEDSNMFGVDVDGDGIFNGLVCTAPDDPAAPYIKWRTFIRDVGSPHAMDLARQLIDECVHGHKLCKHLSTPPPLLPTRLLDCTDPAHPRLVFTSGQHGEYLALSYVWGPDQFHKAMKPTVLLYVEGFDWRILPQTIRDAIFVTHALKFQYLWVDALCITQDDGTDRQHEIGHMHHIYRHATLTIFAASTASASDGFLHERESLDQLILPFICPPSSTSAGFRDGPPVSQLQLGHIHLYRSYQINSSYRYSLGVMATRAWCMQEYLLSPRALIFTATSLIFRCRTTIRGVGNSAYHFYNEPRLPDTLFLRDPPAAEPGSEEWLDAQKAWIEVVRDYSLRSATLESDKLVACAAVAQQFARVLGCDYLAGLWRSDRLLNDLLWRPSYDCSGGRRRRPAAYRAPSWSWAAAEEVFFYFRYIIPIFPWGQSHPEYIALAEIIQSRCEVTLKDPSLLFGEVTGGILVLRGTAIPCRSICPEQRYSGYDLEVIIPSYKDAQRPHWGLGLGNSNSDAEDTGDSGKPEGYTVDVHLDYPADELPGPMWLVPFVYLKNIQIVGLLLELDPPSHSVGSEPDPKTNRFRRVGYFNYGDNDALKHPLWGPLIRDIQDKDTREQVWRDIAIV